MGVTFARRGQKPRGVALRRANAQPLLAAVAEVGYEWPMKIQASSLLVLACLIGCSSAAKEQEPAKSPTSAAAAASTPDSASATDPVSTPVKVGDKAKCPVSGEEFTVASNSPKVTHEGKDYYFCCESCAESFKADPKKYAQ